MRGGVVCLGPGYYYGDPATRPPAHPRALSDCDARLCLGAECCHLVHQDSSSRVARRWAGGWSDEGVLLPLHGGGQQGPGAGL